MEVASAGPTIVTTNEYDGLGRRIVRVDAAASDTYDYYYNDQWQLLEERRDGVTDPLPQYVWHPYYIDALAVRYYDADTNNVLNENNDGAHYYTQDANFNVTAVVNASGTVLERYNYSPYGEVTVLNDDFSFDSSGDDGLSDIGNTHLYTGRERDPETGLQLNRHRYYASHLGRWLTRDPIGYEGSQSNLYEYVKGRSLSASDPSGLWSKRLAICEKQRGPYKDKKSGCDVCDWHCECPRGFSMWQEASDYYRRPCDKAPEIYCTRGRPKLIDVCRVIVGIGLICGTIAEDIGTVGADIADDPVCFAAAGVMICPRLEPEPMGPGPNPMDHMCCGGPGK